MTCPDCGTPLKEIGTYGEWICPVALEAQRRGLLGQPGRKHAAVWIYTETKANDARPDP